MFRSFVTRVSSRAGKGLIACTLTAVAAGCGSSAPNAPTASIVATPTNPNSPGTVLPGSVQGLTALPAGNPSCSDLASAYGAPGATWFELKLDRAPKAAETLTDNVLSVSITNGTSKRFDFTSNRPVDAILVKSGSDGNNLYLYSTEAASGIGLTTPTGQDISHITACYDVELLVSETAATSFTRDYDWSLTKTVDQPSITLAAGAQATVNYAVAATRDAGTDSDWALAGTITVKNDHPSIAASGLNVGDMLSEHGAVAVTCPATSLGPLASMTCSYGPVALANGNSRTNTASAASTTFGIARGERSTPVTFVTPTTVKDASVSATDTFAGAGISSTPLTATRTFTYSRTIQASALACGVNTLGNTVTLTTDDGVARSASAGVIATLTCVTGGDPLPPPPPPPPPAPVVGCGYSQGYWSTHSSNGPAKYDATWAKIGENTPFYLSGNSYYAEINVPAKGNAYHILSSQFIAAKLNVLNGAAAPAGVDMVAIDTFFKTYTPAQIDKMKGSDPVRKNALEWAATLDAYNNGRLNVVHCE